MSVRGGVWQLLDIISTQTGLKKGILIEKAVTFFVKENREALQALGLSTEDADLILSSLKLELLEEAA